MTVLQNLNVKSKGKGATALPGRHPWPAGPSVNSPIFDARFRRHVAHLCHLGVRPVGELLLQVVGTSDDARTALVIFLEQYQRLDADVVAALGGDRWPEAIFPVGRP